jgi:hypothetical protein
MLIAWFIFMIQYHTILKVNKNSIVVTSNEKFAPSYGNEVMDLRSSKLIGRVKQSYPYDGTDLSEGSWEVVGDFLEPYIGEKISIEHYNPNYKLVSS